MNKDVFVQNVKKYCALKGVKPTVACDESGAGKNLIGQLVNRDTVPSVERVQLLAQYLGVTTSDLLGEAQKSSPSKTDRLLEVFGDLTEDEKQDVARYVDLVKARRKQ